jgi:hypothetical protein
MKLLQIDNPAASGFASFTVKSSASRGPIADHGLKMIKPSDNSKAAPQTQFQKL